jgi:acyl-CoA synthetase (NDP forming)
MIDILHADRRKPVFLSLLGDSKDKEACQSFLDTKGLPCYDFPEYAVRVFAHMRQYARIKERR